MSSTKLLMRKDLAEALEGLEEVSLGKAKDIFLDYREEKLKTARKRRTNTNPYRYGSNRELSRMLMAIGFKKVDEYHSLNDMGRKKISMYRRKKND